MPKSDKREYRIMPLMTEKRAEDENQDKSYKVRGYASTFNDPYELYEDWDGNKIYEQIDAHAFDEADMTDTIMQFDHAGMVYARVKNGTLKLWLDEHGLGVEADLGSTEDSKRLYEAIRTGLVDQMSFCFTIVEEAYDKSKRTITVQKVGKVYDVSAVSIPANPGTEISAARKRFLDGVNQEERAERLAEDARQRKIKIMRVKIKLAGGKE